MRRKLNGREAGRVLTWHLHDVGRCKDSYRQQTWEGALSLASRNELLDEMQNN